MNEEINYLKSYDSISEDVKYVANSVIRLKILAALYGKPQNMKELTDKTKLSYSSVSSILHGLELKDFVYRKHNKYHLSNCMKVQMDDILEFKEVVNLLNGFFNIIDGHLIDMIPDQSVSELCLLGKATLLEADTVDVYRIYNFIDVSLTHSNNVQCILPFYHEKFNVKFNELVKKGKFVEALISSEVYEKYEVLSKIKYISSFDCKNTFLLIVSDEVMILGLFRDDGYFDQNRILTSRNEDAIKWARNLFWNFKKRNLNK